MVSKSLAVYHGHGTIPTIASSRPDRTVHHRACRIRYGEVCGYDELSRGAQRYLNHPVEIVQSTGMSVESTTRVR